MSLSAMNHVVWSSEPLSCRDVMANHPAPLLVRVEQGYCSEEDGDSLGQGQIIRIQKWQTQSRVIAKDSYGRHYSFPAQFPVPFELSSGKKRTLRKKRLKTLDEILRDHTLPKTVVMKPNGKPSQYAIGAAFNGEPLELLQTHDNIYLYGNAVNYGSIDPTIIKIPIHASLELKVGQGLESGDQGEWNQLLRDLDEAIERVAKHETKRDDQKILVFMPSRNGDDGDEVLVADVPRSVSSTDDDGPDDITKAFAGNGEIDIDPDRSSTGGSTSNYSIGSGEIIDDDPELPNSNQGNDIEPNVSEHVGEFTSYTQRTSFLLEHADMTPVNGKPSLDLDGFFSTRHDHTATKEEAHPGEKPIFASNVSKLSFLRPESWAGSGASDDKHEELRFPKAENETGSTIDETRSYNKLKNLTIQAKRMRNKMTVKKTDTLFKKTKQKDKTPAKRLTKLSLVPDDVYSLTSQQVLDLLKLLELSEFAPMFAFDRIDGRILDKLTSDELVTKYGMDEDQASKLLEQVNKKDLSKQGDRSLTSYQTTNGALDADYTQPRNGGETVYTNRYF